MTSKENAIETLYGWHLQGGTQMKELLEQFVSQTKHNARASTLDHIHSLNECATAAELEVAFRKTEQWARKQKRICQQVKCLNNRGSDADVKLRKIVSDL